jgi:hypothetical protein
MSKDYDAEAAQARAVKLRARMVGQRYRHYKGGAYVVTSVAVTEATGSLSIHYRSEETGQSWERSYVDFTRSVDVVGEYGKPIGWTVPRFERIK